MRPLTIPGQVFPAVQGRHPSTPALSERCTMASRQEIYRITFLNKGKVYEIFARQVYQSELYGFIEVEDFVFDERSQMLVDPSEEKLKMEFQDVKRSFIPLQAILRIDEVEKTGVAKITNGDNIMPFPMPAFGNRNTNGDN